MTTALLLSLCGTVALVVAGLVAVVLGRVLPASLTELSPSRHQAGADSARWAGRTDELTLAVPEQPEQRSCRIVVGRGAESARLLALADCASAVAFGLPGSGKTTALVVPNVLEWQGSVLTTTAKVADLASFVDGRRRLGPLHVVAPGGAAGYETARWSPVDYAADEEAADRMASWMCEATGHRSVEAETWQAEARNLIGPLLLAAKDIEQFLHWLWNGEDSYPDVVATLKDRGFDDAAARYRSVHRIHDKGKGSVYFTAHTLAEVFAKPSVRRAASASDFTVEAVLEKPSTIAVVTPESQTRRYGAYTTALAAALVHAAETKAAAERGPITPRLLLALDEAAVAFRYRALPELVATARGNGIALLAIYHDLGQLQAIYGRDEARSVLAAARARILLPGVGDPETLDYFAALAGQVWRRSLTSSRDSNGRVSIGSGEQRADLAPLHALVQLPAWRAICQYEGLAPIRLRLRPWFADRELRELSQPTDTVRR